MDNKKKLLLITSGFPFGDTERGFISTEFEYLQNKFDLYILSVGSKEEIIHPFPKNIPVEKYFHRNYSRSFSTVCTLIKNAVRPITIKELFNSLKLTDPIKTLKRIKQILFYVTKAEVASKHIDQLLRTEDIGLVYTYWCTEMTLATALLKNKYNDLKIVTRFHGHDLYTERREEDWQPFRRYISDKADKLVFASEYGLEYYKARWLNTNHDKATLCYLGCKDSTRIPFIKKNKTNIVSCSNLIKLKRVDMIIDALSLLPQDHLIRWDHFGDGEEMASLKKQASIKLGGNIEYHFHGRVPNNTIAENYQQITPDLFITTTSSEGGSPVSIQEAYSMGIPAIGTKTGGVPDIITDQVNGFLVDVNSDAEYIANTIEKFIKLPSDTRITLSNNAYILWQQKFDAEKNAKQFTEMLFNLERLDK